MENVDRARIALILMIIAFACYILYTDQKISRLEAKVIKITHELDYTKGVVEKLNK